LGSAVEATPKIQSPKTAQQQQQQLAVDDFKPAFDSNLSEEERTKIRADRAAAAEARLKKQGIKPEKKKKPSSDDPLRGPNSKPAMTWTLG
jgi:hypothetical protein